MIIVLLIFTHRANNIITITNSSPGQSHIVIFTDTFIITFIVTVTN